MYKASVLFSLSMCSLETKNVFILIKDLILLQNKGFGTQYKNINFQKFATMSEFCKLGHIII